MTSRTEASTGDFPEYIKREPYYACRLVRDLFNSGSVQSIGLDAAGLIVHIAHSEDFFHYRGPVEYWNEQLMRLFGWNSPKKLNNARRRACEAGWLFYTRAHDRAVGRYFTTNPLSEPAPEHGSLSHMGTQNSDSLSHMGTQNSDSLSRMGTQRGRKAENKRPTKGTESGKPSTLPLEPIPKPVPIHAVSVSAKPVYCDAFEEFWLSYPKNRSGRRNGKRGAFTLWKAIPEADREDFCCGRQATTPKIVRILEPTFATPNAF